MAPKLQGQRAGSEEPEVCATHLNLTTGLSLTLLVIMGVAASSYRQ